MAWLKKIWIGIGLVLGIVAACFVAVLLLKKHEAEATAEVAKTLPKEIGVATEEYKEILVAKIAEIQTAKMGAVISKFKSAFGG